MSPGPRVKVLYIAGTGRSGSTLLLNALGELDGFFAAGEVRFIWERNLIGDRVCGCGESFAACPLWRSILDSASIGARRLNIQAVIALRDRVLRMRHLLLGRHIESVREKPGEWKAYADILGRLYRAMASVTNSRVVVDSSKYPLDAWTLSRIPSLDVHLVHLIRDPRAVAHSWNRTKVEETRKGQFSPMGRYSTARVAYDWCTVNVSAELCEKRANVRYTRLRYEDFVHAPRQTLWTILEALNEPGIDLPFLEPRCIHLGPNHTLSGNPNRFTHGSVAIRPDDAWASELARSDMALVTALCLPLLYRYGYSWRHVHHSA